MIEVDVNKVRRAKLYYLREKIGRKASKLKSTLSKEQKWKIIFDANAPKSAWQDAVVEADQKVESEATNENE